MVAARISLFVSGNTGAIAAELIETEARPARVARVCRPENFCGELLRMPRPRRQRKRTRTKHRQPPRSAKAIPCRAQQHRLHRHPRNWDASLRATWEASALVTGRVSQDAARKGGPRTTSRQSGKRQVRLLRCGKLFKLPHGCGPGRVFRTGAHNLWADAHG